MARLSVWMLMMLLVLPAVIQLAERGDKMLAFAEEDEVEGEDEGAVEDDGEEQEAEEEEDPSGGLASKNVHPDVETQLLFTKPAANPVNYAAGVNTIELPAGKIVEFLVGFKNKGGIDEEEFVVESLDASFRYPMDFTYHIQNFSAVAYNKAVKAGQEASVFYSFIPADAFAGRPIGLTINLNYKDASGNRFLDPVFNETVTIVEMDEGFDTEVFFMYVFLAAGVLLLLFLVYSFTTRGGNTKKAGARKPVETGTSNSDDVDYEWIPRSALQKTPGSQKTSPRQRKGGKRGGNSDTE